MTRNETAKVIYMLKATYPEHYMKFSQVDIENALNVWAGIFAEYSFESVKGGVQAYIMNDTKGFPPAPGQVIAMIRAVQNKTGLSPLEAWQKVRKAVQNSNYHAEEEFDKLPPAVQKAIGGPANMRQMAMMDSETFETVEQSHFIRAYSAEVKREQEVNNIPEEVRKLIRETTDKNKSLVSEQAIKIETSDRKELTGE